MFSFRHLTTINTLRSWIVLEKGNKAVRDLSYEKQLQKSYKTLEEKKSYETYERSGTIL